MSKKISVTVNGMEYTSKSEAIRSLLASGLKKSEVCKVLGVRYPFVVNVEKAAKFANSDVGKELAAKKATDTAAKIAAHAEMRAKKAAASKVRAAERQAKAEAVKANKAAKPAKVEKKTTAKVAKRSRKVEAVTDGDAAVIAMAGISVPADVQADMVADGLVSE
jgi:hypothetical protein